MKKVIKIVIYPLSLLLIVGIIWGIYTFSSKTTGGEQTSANPRTTIQLALNPKTPNPQPYTVAANKLPEFTVDISTKKFKQIAQASVSQIKNMVTATIVHQTYASEKIEATVSVDQSKNKLIVHPKDVPNFKPGMYKLHLELRTIEGVVNIEQDFSWGVIAVNTNKSIYTSGETAKIGIGVLNDDGETLCKTGLLHVDDITMTITDPQGDTTQFSLADGTIKDSGKCGPQTVTNEADFQTTYQTTTNGIYQMNVEAIIRGQKREIEDYFKVDQNVPFEIERTSFPTRIYPHPPYPVTFTITPYQDYQGTVEDIVPANFAIEHISDNGHLEQDGEFIKIVWKVDLKKGVAKELTYFINFPRISPEFYLLGPIKVDGFQEARQWQIASDAINSSTGLLSYEDNTSSNTWSRIWSGTAFGSQASMSVLPGDSRWFSERSSPINNEKLVALIDNGGSTPNIDPIYMFRWDGAAWNLDFTIGFTCQQDDTRVFDIAYEDTSGDALLVYNDCTNQLKYRKRVNGAWDGASSNAGTAYDVQKAWIRLKSQPNTDDILIGILNDNRRVGAMIWDGATDSFGDQLADSSGTSTQTNTITEESMGIAWENASGKAMLIYGSGTTTLLYREFNSGWESEQTAYSGLAGPVAWLAVAGDLRLTSDNIAIGILTSSTIRCEFGVWNGSSWVTKGSVITCRNTVQDKDMSVEWEASTGKALWAYATNAAPTQLSYRTWTNAGGSTFSADTLITGTLSNILTVELYSDTNSIGIIALIVTNTGSNLYTRAWDGSSWNSFSASLGTVQTAGDNAEAFGFGFDRFLETLAAYKFFANADSADVGSALAPQDTAVIFNTANPDFRLRLLLYIDPDDSVGSSARQYTLQFVDPGTGTCASPGGDGTPAGWTDVGTGSSTLIAYKDNATPSDGSNLTTNASDPIYSDKTVRPQTYEEQNTFTNSTSAIGGDQAGLWDLALHDNTTYDNSSQTFCFRVMNNAGRVVRTLNYPQITTASIPDALIQGGSLIQGGTILQ